MKRPWQVSIVFAVCLAILLAAMGWTTSTVVRLNQSEADARRVAGRIERKVRLESELEQRVGRALWRLDFMLNGLIMAESARPYFAYAASAPDTPGKTASDDSPVSPWLKETPAEVLLYFQIDPNGTITSPQVRLPIVARKNQGKGVLSLKGPPAKSPPVKEPVVASPPHVDSLAERRLAEFKRFAPRDVLLAAMPVGKDDTMVVLPSIVAAMNPTLIEPQWKRPSQPSSLWKTQSKPSNFKLPLQNDSPSTSPRQQQTRSVQSDQQQAYISQKEQNRSDFNSRALGQRNLDLFNNDNQNFVANKFKTTPAASVRQGAMRAIWIGEALLLTREIEIGTAKYLQGCWLDWPMIRQAMCLHIADLLPEADFEAAHEITNENAWRTLATLPLILSPGRLSESVLAEFRPPSIAPTSLGMSLVVAWICVLFAAAAVAMLMWGALALSERRAAFVSAVTHELRTPLTTFRLYTEMLGSGMITEEEKRREYLTTLQTEADRLSHLVENVLSYARLERRGHEIHSTDLAIKTLIDPICTRLQARAKQSEMTLDVSIRDDDAQTIVCVDPGAVEQILYNLVDNACKYASSARDRRIHLETTRRGKFAVLQIRDHGPGIERRSAGRLFRPFCKRTCDAANTPGVGLGLALSQRLAHSLHGKLQLAEHNADDHDSGDSKHSGATFELLLPLAQ